MLFLFPELYDELLGWAGSAEEQTHLGHAPLRSGFHSGKTLKENLNKF